MSLFCGASSTVAALPFRPVRSPARLQTGAQRVTLGGSHQFSRASLISFSRGSTLSAITAAKHLVSLLESEIECSVVNKDPHDDDKDKLPKGFPFKIIDSLGERVIYLTSKYEDDNIIVQIDPSPPFNDGEEEKQPNGPEEELLIGISMVGKLSKDDDDDLSLEFELNAYVNEIVIDI
ncbi:hypothetical protein N665_0014s0174 [Sinapis alba]|nr:hypothetical protein N665_0014s0174 [Sinapis alba]